MGYALLWTVALAGELLLLATLMACIGQLRRSRIRVALTVLVALVQLFALFALIGAIQWAEAKQVVPNEWGRPIWFLTLCYVVAASWILFRGLRPSRQRPEVFAAATWPRGKLAVSLTAAFALYLMTFWNLDVAVRLRIAALRVEAGAMAASVAPARIPDRDNAALIYQQAYELMPPDESWDKKWTQRLREGCFDFDPEDTKLRQFLEPQAATMRLLRQASEKPGCCFEYDYVHAGIDMPIPGFMSIRHASMLLALDARSKAAAGNLRTALADTNAMFAVAEHAGSEPLLISVLVSVEMDRMACTTLEAVLATREATPDELALLDISDTVSFQRLFGRALRMEEACAIATFCDYGATFRWAELTGGSTPSWQESCLGPLYRVFAFDDDLASYRENYKEYREHAGKPYYQAAPKWQSSGATLEASIRGLITHLLFPALHKAAEHAAVADARHRLARLAKATSRYHDAEDQFPQRLDDLVPEFFPAVPLDPFNGDPLRIKRTDQELVLYSIGPDGADDDGAPFDAKERTGDLTFRLTQ
jgi:hypothetical protein